jgi:putative nucleotidyltransferase with HDIG domain
MTPSSLPARLLHEPGRLTGRTAAVAAGATALLVFACLVTYEKAGPAGPLAVLVPPALLIAVMRRRLARSQASAGEMARANDELRRSNDDLADIVELVSGLWSQAHDSRHLVSYAQSSLSRLLGAWVTVTLGSPGPDGGIVLESGGRIVGSLSIVGGDAERWERLRDAIVPQLSAALTSSTLAEEMRKTHLETIAALSGSMGAKDDYTGAHTERVSDIAVGLAKRLGYSGIDLEAIEIGALMHDIGKIGIPESILHKPGPLDTDEWIVMKRHPVISAVILNEVELSPIVLQIARSSHERMDGGGYPDGLAGEDIPMPARIVFVADAFDALTSDRPYRRARRPRAAVEEIVANKGTQFCPHVVAALERVYSEEPATLGEVSLSVVAAAG